MASFPLGSDGFFFPGEAAVPWLCRAGRGAGLGLWGSCSRMGLAARPNSLTCLCKLGLEGSRRRPGETPASSASGASLESGSLGACSWGVSVSVLGNVWHTAPGTPQRHLLGCSKGGTAQNPPPTHPAPPVRPRRVCARPSKDMARPCDILGAGCAPRLLLCRVWRRGDARMSLALQQVTTLSPGALRRTARIKGPGAS